MFQFYYFMKLAFKIICRFPQRWKTILRKCSAWKHALIDVGDQRSFCHPSILLFLPLLAESNLNINVQKDDKI